MSEFYMMIGRKYFPGGLELYIGWRSFFRSISFMQCAFKLHYIGYPVPSMGWSEINQTVNDGVDHSKSPRKCAYHVTFDLDLDLEHTLDAGSHVQVWWRSDH